MVRLREIPRTATFAWSPGAGKPLVVTGTRAGAVDADFSDETKLEIWDLSLDDESQGLELQPIVSISAEARFDDIAWAPGNDEHPQGLIAGALENGALNLWDAAKLINGDSDANISQTRKHSGTIKSLQFNPLKPQILATAGTKGELFIYDVNDINNPFRLGNAAARADDLNCIAWNRKVPHILATGGVGGFVTVWDLKTKKASLTLNNNRKGVSAIAWDPQNATKLLTATTDDTTPVILLWNLRNSNEPERTMQGHEQGILSLSWCPQDSDLLLSCGKDKRTLCWNPQTGERFGEFPEMMDWSFQTEFHPHNPNLSATAAFDGKIVIQTLQSTNSNTSQATSQGATDAEDFFAQPQTQQQGATFTLPKAPKWFERPVGVSFGFGGKLVRISLQDTAPGQPRSSKISISQFEIDSGVGSAADDFESALKAHDMKSICESHITSAKTDEEKADWAVIQALITDNPRESVIKYLGVSAAEETNGVDEPSSEDKPEETTKKAADAKKHARGKLSVFFADGSDDFLANLAAGKGAKTDNPFQLYGESDSESDKQITKALMLGDFEKATTICIKENRLADAFMIATCGGKELLDQVQAAYLAQKAQGSNYVRLISSIITKNLWDVVYNADIADWKEIMGTLCTHAQTTEFSDLCEALGDRMLEAGSRKDASFCYLAGSKLEKVTNIWIEELKEVEDAEMKEPSGDSSFSVHAHLVQSLIEKVTVFRAVTKFHDQELGLSSGWKLATLYDKYVEYADIVAAHGHLAIAEKYLDLLPTTYPPAETARNRVKLATRKAGAPAARSQKSAPQAARVAPQYAYGASAQAPAPTSFVPPAPAPVQNAYTPVARPPSTSQNMYTPSGATSSNYQPAAAMSSNYTPQTNFQPISQTPLYGAGNTAPAYGQGSMPNSFAPPPRNTTPSAPPPSLKNMGNWNDTPMVSRPPPTKRTPQPVISGPTTPSLPGPPPLGNQFAPPRAAATPPPPPKGAASPNVTSPPMGTPPQHFSQPSAAANAYAPPPTQSFGQPVASPHTIPRGASPYNPPPTTAPPSNRYAPAPAAPTAPSHMAPPPLGGVRPPPNPYAPNPGLTGPHVAQAPPLGPPMGAPPMGAPPTGAPPMGGPPMGGPPRSHSAASNAAPPSRAAAPPAKPKHPAGDRSHIPDSARELVDIFTADMQRVAAKAPASFAPQVKDTQKRLNILFDHLNNEELLKPDTIERVTELARALQARDFDTAAKMQVEIQTEKTDECAVWMPGVKRLISMSKVTP